MSGDERLDLGTAGNRGGVRQRREQVLSAQLVVPGEQLFESLTCREQLEDHRDGDPRAPDPRLGVTRSMGAVGTSADNAMAESFNATLERETLAGAHGWPDAATARREVFAW